MSADTAKSYLVVRRQQLARGVDVGDRGLDADHVTELLQRAGRLSGSGCVAGVVWQATAPIPPPIWWSYLERAMLAFEDLHCAEFLD